MVFANYEGNVDVYMRASTWQADLWSLYKIDYQSVPVDWHKSMTMRHINNSTWPMDALSDKKRKRDNMAIDEPGEDAMGTDASIYETALHAMTPIALNAMTPRTAIESPSTETERLSDHQL